MALSRATEGFICRSDSISVQPPHLYRQVRETPSGSALADTRTMTLTSRDKAKSIGTARLEIAVDLLRDRIETSQRVLFIGICTDHRRGPHRGAELIHRNSRPISRDVGAGAHEEAGVRRALPARRGGTLGLVSQRARPHQEGLPGPFT